VDIGGLSTMDTLEIVEAAHSSRNDCCGDCRSAGQALHSGDVILLLRSRELSPKVKSRQVYMRILAVPVRGHIPFLPHQRVLANRAAVAMSLVFVNPVPERIPPGHWIPPSLMQCVRSHGLGKRCRQGLGSEACQCGHLQEADFHLVDRG
jgi:hypothetical protein